MIAHIQSFKHVGKIVDGKNRFQRLIRTQRRVTDHRSEQYEPIYDVWSYFPYFFRAEIGLFAVCFRPANSSPSPKKLPNSV